MRNALFLFVAVLVVAHQDFFNWDNSNLVLGCLPVGLAYHVGFTLVTVSMWAVATRVAWPSEDD